MLDIFGNVFGRSKKNQSNHSSNASDQENNDGFIVLGQTGCEQSSLMMANVDDPPPLYPTTILTDDMIRLGASSVSSSVSSVQSQSLMGVSSSSVSYSQITRTHQRMNSYSSPIDCVPFTASTVTSSCGIDSVNSSTHSEDKCLAIIDRIGQYLSTPSQSEYSFNLENSILSESLLCYHKN